MKNSVRAAYCGILTALAVMFMILITVLPIMMYVCPILSGMCIAIAAKEFGIRYSVGVYLAISILSVLIVADKEAVSIFILLLGVYPVLKFALEKKVKSRFAVIAVKFIYINAACFAYFYLAVGLLGVPLESFGKVPFLMLALSNFIMFMYDKIIDKYCGIYYNKFRKKIMKGFR